VTEEVQATEQPTLLTRRAALKRAVAFLGGTMTVAQLGLLTRGVAAVSENSGPRYLGEDQFLMLKRVVDLIIPETDTPGAVGARVHQFIDLMLAEWASPARRSRYLAGLEDIDRRARHLGGKDFAENSKTAQLEVLRQLDDEAFAPGFPDTFFGELKKMTLFAYYSSEPGATDELRFQRIPGDYQPCLPMEEDGRAWFWNGYSHGL
jgi:hypothetical protein